MFFPRNSLHFHESSARLSASFAFEVIVMELFGYSIWVILLICVGVFLAGFVDSIGGGGGLIALPAYLFAGLPVHLALGTNKLSSCIGTAASTLRYIRNGFVDWKLVIPSIVLALIGSHLGTRLQLLVDEVYLKYLLLPVLPVVAFVVLRQKNFSEERGDMSFRLRGTIVWAASLIIGAYDGFYGPGTGTFLLLVFCKLAKLDLRTASGNVKLVNLASNTSSFVTALTAGTVLVPVGLIAAVFSIAGHYLGAGLTIKNGSKAVRPVILVVLALLLLEIVLELF